MPRLFGPHVQRTIAQSSSIWIKTTCGSGLGLKIWIGQMRIQCERIQTRFDPVQCSLDVQCEQAFKLLENKIVTPRALLLTSFPDRAMLSVWVELWLFFASR